jgi:transposase-like protein
MPPQKSTPVRRASYSSTCAVPAVQWIDLFYLVLSKQSSVAALCRQHRLPESVFRRRYQRFQQANDNGVTDQDVLNDALLDRRCYSRRALTDEQEQLIVQSFDNSNQARMPINYNDVKLQATQLYKDTHPHALRDVTNFQASNGFIEGFKQRHCTVTRTASTISRLSNNH